MLHFNTMPSIASREEDQLYKVLILDRSTKDVLAPLLKVSELRRHGVTLHLLIDSERQPIPDVPAVYYVSPDKDVIEQIADDAKKGLYDSFYLNFSTHISRPLMEHLATHVASSGTSAARIARLQDQYNEFIALEGGLFSLGMPDTYLKLNDPGCKDSEIESTVSSIVDRLMCVLVTLGVIPIIRCPRGGAAEHVAAALDARLRDALKSRGNLFANASAMTGLGSSIQRPLLCLFDRTFEMSVVLQHSWTYKPLVHDVLNMHLNRIVVEETPGGLKKSYEVDETDFFWTKYGKEQFPHIAEQVESELAGYKSAIEDLNRRTASGDAMADPLAASTRGLMSAVSSLPELTERKRILDKHTNIATALLGLIKSRTLDHFYAVEEDFISGKANVAELEELLQNPAGSPTDKLRAALVWILTAENVPTEADINRIEVLLGAACADLTAWSYVKRMRRMNLTGKQQQITAASDSLGGAQSQFTSLIGSTFGQGLSSLTKGVKNLLAGEQQAAVTVAVESLMDGKASPETENYAYFDPKSAGQAQRAAVAYKEALVFMVGGGNFLEYESLTCWASRAQPTPKHVVYGATELLSGEQFAAQLSQLARRSGIM